VPSLPSGDLAFDLRGDVLLRVWEETRSEEVQEGPGEAERGRKLFALQCLIHAEQEPMDLREGKSVPALALQYGASAKLTKDEVDAVLGMTVKEILK